LLATLADAIFGHARGELPLPFLPEGEIGLRPEIGCSWRGGGSVAAQPKIPAKTDHAWFLDEDMRLNSVGRTDW